MALVRFRCPSCGHEVFRQRTAYERMMATSGGATCLLCPRSAYTAPPSRQELLAVTQALNALSREGLSAHRQRPTLHRRGACQTDCHDNHSRSPRAETRASVDEFSCEV